MSTDEILRLELSLLLVKYGERKVLKSLATVNGLKDDELETQLRRIRHIEKKTSARKRSDPSKAIQEIIALHPQKARLLELLYSRFQSRTFLPELRDVKRLFDRYSYASKNLRSRNNSAPRVFRVLADLDAKELEELTQEQDKTAYSSLGIISDEIMKRS